MSTGEKRSSFVVRRDRQVRTLSPHSPLQIIACAAKTVRQSPRIAVLIAVVTLTWSASAGETIYNGIVLPDTWPPRIERLTREPMPVPYLEHRPDVVPIDVGRQLFVDDFLIEQTTLHRIYHTARYHSASPVLRPDKPWESASKTGSPPRPIAMVFSDGVCYDPADGLFKMWYMGGPSSSICYAFSKDGIYWEKPSLDVVPGTNIVLDRERDSTTVWLDQKERDPAKRYKLLAYVPPKGSPDSKTNPWKSVLYYSADGIHWGQPVATRNEECDRSTCFYNPFRNRWVFSLRSYIAWPVYRCRYYAESRDLDEHYPHAVDHAVRWTCSDQLDPYNPNAELKDALPQLYNLDAVGYESLLLGLFSIHQGQYEKAKGLNKRNEILLGFSRDGFHWQRPDRRAFAGVSETEDTWNWGNVQSAGGACLVVGDQLYFYVSGRGKKAATDPCSTGLAVLRRDGFASMETGSEPGTLTTRPLTFKGGHLFVNADITGGELQVEILDRDGKVLPAFGKEQCLPVTKDGTIQPVRWKHAHDLSAMAGKPVRFRFHLHHGKLYSFWVSPEESGASHGYVASGGPGYPGQADTVGTAALTIATAAAVQNICPTAPVIACPAWVKETVPVWVQPHLGKYGLPAPYPQLKAALGNCTAGIDIWQANHFVGYCAETARYLYDAYTPATLEYHKGGFPLCEKVVEQYTAGLTTDREKAMALLTRAMPDLIAHPSIPPYSADVRPDRAMGEDELLKSGLGWCNEQARVYARLCQAAGIPARLIFVFYSDNDGHVISEFYADGRWCMADSSWGCVFPGADGKLMSAAQCFADAESKHRVQESYLARAREVAAFSDAILVGRRYADILDAAARASKIAEHASDLRQNLRSGRASGKLGENLRAFGVMNMPLPR